MKKLFIALLFVLALPAFAHPITDLPVNIGDSIEKVKAALNTNQELEDTKSAVNKGSTALRLRTKGIWIFFDSSGTVYTMRVDAPFIGKIKDIGIGSTHRRVLESLGKPAKTIKSNFNIGILAETVDPHIYYPDDRTTMQIKFDKDGLVETIFLTK
jgi:hypothetical protein